MSVSLHVVTQLFVKRCGYEPLFVNNKMTASYFKVKRYLMKCPDISLDCLHEYLEAIDVKPRPMWEVVNGAREYQSRLRALEMAKVVQAEQVSYKEYSLEDL